MAWRGSRPRCGATEAGPSALAMTGASCGGRGVRPCAPPRRELRCQEGRTDAVAPPRRSPRRDGPERWQRWMRSAQDAGPSRQRRVPAVAPAHLGVGAAQRSSASGMAMRSGVVFRNRRPLGPPRGARPLRADQPGDRYGTPCRCGTGRSAWTVGLCRASRAWGGDSPARAGARIGPQAGLSLAAGAGCDPINRRWHEGAAGAPCASPRRGEGEAQGLVSGPQVAVGVAPCLARSSAWRASSWR